VVAARTEALFRRSGAFREGHFQLKSGRHGDAYVEKFQVLQDPAATSELCTFFAVDGRGGDGETLVNLVAGPTTGGVILAFETARQLGVRSIFAEEVRADDGTTHRAFRRGFRIEPGERLLLVDDIMTTGGSLQAMLPAVEDAGGEIVSCLVLVDRSGGRATLTSPRTGRTYPLRSLWQLDLPTYEAGSATCPRCADGQPLHAPGSLGTGAPAAAR
jgi:orotate phosphoribosyltransferase